MSARLSYRRNYCINTCLLLVILIMGSPGSLQALPEGEPTELGISTDRLTTLQATLETFEEDEQLAGGVLLVAREGQTVFHQAFGYRDREAGDAMVRDDLFRIASQTKVMISVAIMMLQEQGQLLLNDPQQRYLPEFADTTVAVSDDDGSYSVETARRPITLKGLLTHTAGIGYGKGVAADRWAAAGLQEWYLGGRDEPIRGVVRRMAELAMNDTRFFLDRDNQRQRLATVYSATAEGLTHAPDGSRMPSQGDYALGPQRTFSGGAGLISTAEDYGRFLQMLLNGGQLNERRLLSPKSVQLMTADHLGDASGFSRANGFGFGFSLRNDLGSAGTPGSVGEFSRGGAYHSTYWVDPAEELVLVYLMQLIPADEIRDFELIRARVYQAIIDSNVSLHE